jgi:putative transposase
MAHPPRIPVWLPPDKPVVYFVTICVQNRRPVLATQEAFAALQKTMANLDRWWVFAAILMPDHAHFLVAPREREIPLGNFSATVKRWMRRELHADWQWQTGCFDRLLRSDESAQQKWEYVRENPVRAGLVKRWQDWPYSIGFREKL